MPLILQMFIIGEKCNLALSMNPELSSFVTIKHDAFMQALQ